MNRLKKLIPRGIKMFRENNMSIYSGYATLFIVTSLFPLIILILSIVNLIPGSSAKDVADILLRFLPGLESIKDLLESLLTDAKAKSGGLLASVAAVSAFWAASKGVWAIQRGLIQLEHKRQPSETKDHEISEITAKGKGYIKGIVKRLLFTLLLVIMIPAMLVFEMLRDSLTHIHSLFDARSLAVMLYTFLVILLIYAVLPPKRRTIKSQLPGAIFTEICWIAFTELFSFFIPRFYRASNLYGSLAAVFLVLLWLRYMVMILFAGGVLNRTLEESREEAC